MKFSSRKSKIMVVGKRWMSDGGIIWEIGEAIMEELNLSSWNDLIGNYEIMST